MAKASHEVSEDIASALKRLIGGGRGGMGSIVQGAWRSRSPISPTLAGFADDQEPTARTDKTELA